MHPQLKQAYNLGVKAAQDELQKTGNSLSDILPSILGAIPMAGPPLAGYAASKSTPFEPKEVAARTGSKAGLGQAIGGLGGAALGAGIGAGATALHHKYRDPEGWKEEYFGKEDPDYGRGAGLGALLGSSLGSAAGGAYGAHKGKQEATEVASGEYLQKLIAKGQEEAAKRKRNMRILNALGKAHQFGSHGLPLRLQITPNMAQALQRQQQGR